MDYLHQHSLLQILRRIRGKHGDHLLRYDWPVVVRLIHKMDGRARESDTENGWGMGREWAVENVGNDEIGAWFF